MERKFETQEQGPQPNPLQNPNEAKISPLIRLTESMCELFPDTEHKLL